MIKIATWNVNSVKARLPLLLRWLEEFSPDVLLLQELKCIEEAFPRDEIEDKGYNVAVKGQKTYNGVAILSKSPIEIDLNLISYDPEGNEISFTIDPADYPENGTLEMNIEQFNKMLGKI